MARRGRGAGPAVGGALVVVMGVVAFGAGLEVADQLASVAGLFVGLTGLFVMVYGLRRPENPPRADQPEAPAELRAPPEPESPPRVYRGDHIEITGNIVRGDVIGKIDGTPR